MQLRPSHLDDAQRLDALRDCGLLDTPAEEAFDRLTRLAARVLDVPIALVTLVDRDRGFHKSSVGLPEPWSTTRETPLSYAFAPYLVTTGKPLVVADARQDPVLRESRAVTELGHVACVGVPLAAGNGSVLGALCAIDTEPREWSDGDLEVVQDLAAAAAREMDLRARLRAVERERDRLTDEVRRASQTRDDTLGIVSHDLRNPIHTIFMSASFLQDILPDEATVARDHARVMKRSAERANRLIGDLLDMTGIERGQLSLDRRLHVAAELVHDAIEQANLTAAARGVALSAGELDERLVIRADRDRVLQALGNLIGNALKFTPAGGRVRVSVTLEGDRARLAVDDSGPGIPPEHRAHLFDRFWQANRTDRRGVGLGLSIVKGIVEGHGGEVQVESTLGAGSMFALLLPVADRREPVREHDARLPPWGGAGGARDSSPDLRA